MEIRKTISNGIIDLVRKHQKAALDECGSPGEAAHLIIETVMETAIWLTVCNSNIPERKMRLHQLLDLIYDDLSTCQHKMVLPVEDEKRTLN
jgi:spore maturation protein SpmB